MCHLADSFHPIFWVCIFSCSRFHLPPRFLSWLFYFSFVQISNFWLYDLKFAVYRAEAFQHSVKTPESFDTITNSCPISPWFTKIAGTLDSITYLITNQPAAPKCALSLVAPGLSPTSVLIRHPFTEGVSSLTVSLEKWLGRKQQFNCHNLLFGNDFRCSMQVNRDSYTVELTTEETVWCLCVINLYTAAYMNKNNLQDKISN